MTYSCDEVLKAFRNETETVIPISFWRHFAESEFIDGLQHPEVIQLNLAGHKKFIDETQPDFVKTMSDGYFAYPFLNVTDRTSLSDWRSLETLPEGHPWLSGQYDLAVAQNKLAGKRPTFYTIFSPMILFKWALINHETEPLTLSDHRFADFYEENPVIVKQVLFKIAQDLKKLIRIVLKSGIEGIYYSTQSIQDYRVDNKEFFEDIMEAVDLEVQEEIKRCFDLNILHICGFAGATNHLEWFTNYPLQVINWATDVDGYSLAQGKKLFGDRPVLGGFGNDSKSILYSGTKSEIQAEAKRIVAEAGRRGVIIGADCTIPRDTPIEHLQWAIEAVHQL
ncbi:MAG: uroporphyrinogen decarboxylase [Liquorilactobacillus nagelii]|jgi:uroporphyrinogen decarboxylase|uniref:uroporphyrinogen decarboxylase family protein n=1 Tax=Liquorilactobacillus nagelii TaxID=82688 RepID=UPI00242F56EA|nr:uroporphyrinogen decarboxylase family protein [Liquorilactobacillus nagelii]MCI1632762.1 uroporphyrinogen decarboxylase [Liquorilactobacillus nagelii]MCI1921655.1 uroporphyrinogen decarboxylase [Liquorilactobacillus nagelii]MCI1976313.1 uroporphyrinogen decarboxylase [Liquorilactobacillus nagelii]